MSFYFLYIFLLRAKQSAGKMGMKMTQILSDRFHFRETPNTTTIYILDNIICPNDVIQPVHFKDEQSMAKT